MKKESFGNSRKCLGQKNLGASDFKIPEISLAQLMLEQFTVNKETYKILLDIIYERDNHIYMREVTDFIDKFKKVIS